MEFKLKLNRKKKRSAVKKHKADDMIRVKVRGRKRWIRRKPKDGQAPAANTPQASGPAAGS